MAKPIALAADHGGFELKEAVKAHLEELGLEYIDFGTHSTDSVDYPDMAVPACDAVVSGFRVGSQGRRSDKGINNFYCPD